jgi:hypothetical protein
MKSVDFSCDGRIIATGSDDKSVKVTYYLKYLDY